jgi:hypothetical protein
MAFHGSPGEPEITLNEQACGLIESKTAGLRLRLKDHE